MCVNFTNKTKVCRKFKKKKSQNLICTNAKKLNLEKNLANVQKKPSVKIIFKNLW